MIIPNPVFLSLSLPPRDLSGRCEFAEEKLRKTSDELEKAKDSREQMYERYVLSREEVKTQYEEKLQVEMRCWMGQLGEERASQVRLGLGY